MYVKKSPEPNPDDLIDLYSESGGECLSLPPMCGFASCRHNMEMHITQDGIERWHDNCCLRIAAGGAVGIDKLSRLIGISKAKIVAAEKSGIKKLQSVENVTMLGALMR